MGMPKSWPQSQLDRVLIETEVVIDTVEQVAEIAHFLDQLILAHEDVRIVLGELAHAHDAVERAVRLVAVAAAELRHLKRQVAVAGDPLLEDQHVRRAVHGLERHPLGIVRY